MHRQFTLAGVFCIAALLLAASSLVSAQTTVQVQKAELSVPFGTPVAGKIVLMEDKLLFIDDEQIEASFAILRTNVRDVAFSQENLVSVSTNQPIKNRSGLQSVFNFRLSSGAAAVLAWRAPGSAPPSAPAADTAKTAPGAAAEEKPIFSYSAQHDHLVGSCAGTLAVTETRVTFEAPKKTDHSRQWQLRDIRSIKQQGPYVLEVEPYTEGKYKFQLLGSGMDVKDYEAIVAKVSSARAGK
jgi:hypothetical protein